MGDTLRSMARAVAVTAIVAVTAGIAVGSPASSTDVAAEYAAMEELPTQAADAADIEQTAIELADTLEVVPVSEEQHDIACPVDRLEVSWEEPVGYEQGALVEPVGPAPTPDTREVNGVVVCEGSTFAFMGFQAKHEDGFGWRVTAVPFYEENEAREPEPLELRYLDALEPTLGSLLDLGPIDDYAPYEPQRLCHAVPKPGAVALAQLLLEAYPGTESYGIGRPCDVGRRSEHKEGRAFDWGASIQDPEQAAAVEDMLQRLLATDTEGNEHALARRLGVMYIIWDDHIWASYRAEDGWRPYSGPSAHTDHVHISLSWDGALGRTSLWEVALDEIDLRQIDLGYLGTLPPADGAAGDATEVRRGFFRQRADDQRAEAEQERAREDEDGTTEDGSPVPGSDGGDEGESTETVTETTDDATETVTDTVDDVTDTVDEVTDPIDEPVPDAMDGAADTVEDTVDQAGDALGGGGDGVLPGATGSLAGGHVI